MDFDLLKQDRKLVPASATQGKAFQAQLQRDLEFLLAQQPPVGPDGILRYSALPEAYRGKPGLMDYSLLLGIVPRGTSGGCVRLDAVDVSFSGYENGSFTSAAQKEVTVLAGII